MSVVIMNKDGSRVVPGMVTDAQRKVAEQEEALKKLKEEPRLIATVVEIRGDHMSIALSPGNGLDVNTLKDARVGDRVLCSRQTMQASEIIHDDVPTGVIVMITKVSATFVEADRLGEPHTYRLPPNMKVKKGERVVLDPSAAFVIGSLGMPPASFSLTTPVSVAWDDVGGHVEAKAHLREAIELPFSHPTLFTQYGKKMVKGVLLVGPPGCGKTILGKAAATSIAKAHGKAEGGFIYIKGPELLSAYVGKSEESVRRMFEAAREHKAKHGFPAVVLMDECDALLARRDRNTNVALNATIVPQFLAEMDGFDDHAAMFILCTNKPELLDPAVVREGRIDRKVKVDRPGRNDASVIFKIHLRGRPLVGDGHIERGVDELYSDRYAIHPRVNGDGHVLLRDFVSGAMIANVIEMASTAAVMRDITSKRSHAMGISVEDILWAIEQTARGQRDIAPEIDP